MKVLDEYLRSRGFSPEQPESSVYFPTNGRIKDTRASCEDGKNKWDVYVNGRYDGSISN